MTLARTLLCSLVLLSACARTSGTVEVPGEELPFSVARGTSAPETGAPPRAHTIYFVRDGRLAATERTSRSEAEPVEAALQALLRGPTRAERARGMSSEIPAGVEVLAVDVTRGRAVVDLSTEFQEPAPPERIARRVAQVVWTLTVIPGVRSVAFSISGETVAVTTAAGDAVDRPVTRRDYGDLAAPG